MAAPPGLELPQDVEPPPGLPAPTSTVVPPPGLNELRRGDDDSAQKPAECALEFEHDASAEDSKHDESADVVVRVRVCGLPNSLLSGKIMEAVLQQAGLVMHVVGLTMEQGEPCGEATMSFANPFAAAFCANHFHGCQWDESGTEVTVEVLPFAQDFFADPLANLDDNQLDFAAGMPRFMNMWEDAPTQETLAAAATVLRSGAAEFVPLGQDAQSHDTTSAEASVEVLSPWAAQFVPAFADVDGGIVQMDEMEVPAAPGVWHAPELSALAPAFVPSTLSVAAEPFVPGGLAQTDASAGQKQLEKTVTTDGALRSKFDRGITSDTSTEIGESDEDEKEHAAAWT